jgi:hypothetical protein
MAADDLEQEVLRPWIGSAIGDLVLPLAERKAIAPCFGGDSYNQVAVLVRQSDESLKDDEDTAVRRPGGTIDRGAGAPVPSGRRTRDRREFTRVAESRARFSTLSFDGSRAKWR